MKHVTEEDLIAYQLGEPTRQTVVSQIAAHLEICSLCAGHAEEIAQTLRIFTADPVPAPNLDHAWQRLRVTLPPLQPARPRWSAGAWLRVALPVLAMLLVASFFTLRYRTHALSVTPPTAHLAPGPLSEQPRDAEIANHLEDAERLLTVLSHEPGAPDAATRARAEELLMQNAVYVHQARAAGDLPEASVLEDLGRTLTLLNHAPGRDEGWHLRMELNANGLLLDIRILQQNDVHDQVAGTARSLGTR